MPKVRLATQDELLSKTNPKLQKILDDYITKTSSTGCDYLDYATLYHSIRNNKFKEIFEAGTGVSTVAIAYALYENHKDGGPMGHVTSMEELKPYHKTAVDLMPKFLSPYVDILFSKTVTDFFGVFRGFRYDKVPNKKYDFCWIDGPAFKIPQSKGKLAFDFDLINILLKTKGRLFGFIDGRGSTAYVMQQIFGEKVKFTQKGTFTGIINGASYDDLVKMSGGTFYMNKVKKIEDEVNV